MTEADPLNQLPHAPELDEHASGVTRRGLLRGILGTTLAAAVGAEMQTATPSEAAVALAESNADAANGSNVTMETHPITAETDVLREGTWNMPGAEKIATGMRLTPLGMQMENRDSGTYTPYSIINQFGTRIGLTGSGDFSVATTITRDDPGAACTYELFGQPPIIYDDGQWNRSKVSLRGHGSTLEISIWDGSSQGPAFTTNFTSPSSLDGKSLEVRRSDGKLTILSDGTVLGQVDERGVFSSGELWFGFAAESSPATVGDVTITPGEGCQMTAVDTATVTAIKQNSFGLQNQVNGLPHPVKMGFAIATPLAFDKAYADLALRGEYGIVTLENLFKPEFVQSQPGVFNFKEADAIIDIMHRNNIDVHAHTAVFARSLPEWMTSLPSETSAQKAYGRQVMRDHITGMLAHCQEKGVVSCDVINELFDDPPASNLRQHIWYKFFDDPAAGLKGEDYIADALRTARAAAPDVKLFINENGLETPFLPARWNAMRTIVTNLVQQGVPLDGIGFQSHIYSLPTSVEDPITLTAHLKAFQKLGLKVRISEADVTGDEGDLVQATQYAAVLGTALANGADFVTWGDADRYGSTTNHSGTQLQYGNALPWDVNLNAKTTVVAMLATIWGVSIAEAYSRLAAA